MRAAFDGDTGTWRDVNAALRDAMADHAARRCAFYRELGLGAGDFERFPVLTRADVADHVDGLLAEGVPEHRRVPTTTSGTSGQALRFFRDSSQGPMEDLSARRFLMRLAGIEDWWTMVWVAANPILEPHQRSRRRSLPGLLGDALAGRRRGPAAPRTVQTRGLTPDRAARELRAWGRLPDFWLYGHASAIDWLASVATRPVDPPAPRPKAVVTTSDTLTEPALERIGRVFECPVHSWYGSHEFNGFVAGTLPGSVRYAFNPLLVHIEVVDDRGRPVAPGELGRLVLTDLNNWVMPFVRYDTGDIAARATEEWHGGWPVVDRIEGRSSEVLRLPDGRVLSAVTVGAWVVKYGGGADRVRQFQAQQTAPDELELRVVWDRPPAPEERAAIEGRLRDLAGPTVRTRLVEVEALEALPSGKVWVVRRTFR